MKREDMRECYLSPQQTHAIFIYKDKLAILPFKILFDGRRGFS